MMPKKCKYALEVLIHLGREYGGGNLLTDDIAKSEHISKEFLERVLFRLLKARDMCGVSLRVRPRRFRPSETDKHETIVTKVSVAGTV